MKSMKLKIILLLVIFLVKERELMSKSLSKYIASFDYFDKWLIVLSVTTGSISIASFANVMGAPVGTLSASFSLVFSLFTGIVKKLLKATRRMLSNYLSLKTSLNKIPLLDDILFRIQFCWAQFQWMQS